MTTLLNWARFGQAGTPTLLELLSQQTDVVTLLRLTDDSRSDQHWQTFFTEHAGGISEFAAWPPEDWQTFFNEHPGIADQKNLSSEQSKA